MASKRSRWFDSRYFLGFFVGKVLDALQCPEVEFDPYAFVFVVVETVCMASEAVHMAE